jgi:hypothetical protein
MTGSGSDAPMDPLTSAVVETARQAAADARWGLPARLYALASRGALAPFEASLPPQVSAVSDDMLIPIEQDQEQLPTGNLNEVLAGIRWPANVPGCVLVTEVTVEDSGQRGRLTVGVMRDGDQQARYACALQLQDDEQLIVEADLADDLVSALLGTL